MAGSPLHVGTGAGGGLAEAVMARAKLDRQAGIDGPWLARGHDYARLFLDHQYAVSDRSLLGQPENLIGGFRATPWSLDVRVDAVQHIGCALLDLEALLREG